jgi:hypothetical protein
MTDNGMLRRRSSALQNALSSTTRRASCGSNGIGGSLANIIYAASTATNADWFTYTVSDGKGGTAIGTNIVNVSTSGVLVVY